MLQGGTPPPPRSSPISHRPQGSGTNEGASRSPSPGVRASAGLRTRPTGASAHTAGTAARASPPPRAAASGTSPSSRQVQHSEGLNRVQSEKTLSRSPHTGRKDSRSPSQERGGRSSPAAPPPARGAGPRMTPMDRRLRPDGRALSPSQSEGSLPTVQRLVSAPVDSHRSVTVRTANATRPRVGSGYGITNRASPSVAGRRHSPEKSAVQRGGEDATPRSAREAKDSARVSVGEDVSSGEAEEPDDDFGPRRRRLSTKQYDALVRCAQQVVTVSSIAPMPAAPAPQSAAAAPLRSSPMRHRTLR